MEAAWVGSCRGDLRSLPEGYFNVLRCMHSVSTNLMMGGDLRCVGCDWMLPGWVCTRLMLLRYNLGFVVIVTIVGLFDCYRSDVWVQGIIGYDRLIEWESCLLARLVCLVIDCRCDTGLMLIFTCNFLWVDFPGGYFTVVRTAVFKDLVRGKAYILNLIKIVGMQIVRARVALNFVGFSITALGALTRACNDIDICDFYAYGVMCDGLHSRYCRLLVFSGGLLCDKCSVMFDNRSICVIECALAGVMLLISREFLRIDLLLRLLEELLTIECTLATSEWAVLRSWLLLPGLVFTCLLYLVHTHVRVCLVDLLLALNYGVADVDYPLL
eukprot:gene2998-1980_t